MCWDFQIHLGDKPDHCFIQIEINQFIQPKHGRGGKVFAEPELPRELRTYKARSKSNFVVNSPVQWKRIIHYRYRCEPHWKVLNTRLAGKGITDHNKIHFLGKAFGDAQCNTHGFSNAKAQLRYASVQMTEKHYADPAQRAPLPVAGMLRDETVKALPDQEVEDVMARLAGLPPAALVKVAAAAQKLCAAPSLPAVSKCLTASAGGCGESARPKTRRRFPMARHYAGTPPVVRGLAASALAGAFARCPPRGTRLAERHRLAEPRQHRDPCQARQQRPVPAHRNDEQEQDQPGGDASSTGGDMEGCGAALKRGRRPAAVGGWAGRGGGSSGHRRAPLCGCRRSGAADPGAGFSRCRL